MSARVAAAVVEGVVRVAMSRLREIQYRLQFARLAESEDELRNALHSGAAGTRS